MVKKIGALICCALITTTMVFSMTACGSAGQASSGTSGKVASTVNSGSSTGSVVSAAASAAQTSAASKSSGTGSTVASTVRKEDFVGTTWDCEVLYIDSHDWLERYGPSVIYFEEEKWGIHFLQNPEKDFGALDPYTVENGVLYMDEIQCTVQGDTITGESDDCRIVLKKQSNAS